MPLADDTLLAAVEAEVLRADCLKRMFDRVVEIWRQEAAVVDDPAAVMARREERKAIDVQMRYLVGQVNMMGPSKVIAEEIRTLEQRRAALEQAERPASLPPAVDRDRLRALLGEWRARHPGRDADGETDRPAALP